MGRDQSVQVLMHRNVSVDKHDLLACVNKMRYPSDAKSMHKFSVVLQHERRWSTANNAALDLCEFQKCCAV